MTPPASFLSPTCLFFLFLLLMFVFLAISLGYYGTRREGHHDSRPPVSVDALNSVSSRPLSHRCIRDHTSLFSVAINHNLA